MINIGNKLKFLGILFVVAFSVFHFSNIALADINIPIANMPITDGDVLAIAYDPAGAGGDGIVYIGGTFNHVMAFGVDAGVSNIKNHIAAFNATTGAIIDSFAPNIRDTVRAVSLSVDGSALYAGGDFIAIGATTVHRLAKLSTTDGSVDSTFNANVDVNASVHALLLNNDDSHLYVGGEFTTLNNGTDTRNHLGAVDISDGSTFANFNPNITGSSVDSLVFSGDKNTIYLGGTFSKFNNATTRNNLAALDSNTGSFDYGAVTAFNPNVNAVVHTVKLSNDQSTLYFGGEFTNVGGCGMACAKNYLASVNTGSFILDSFDPNPDGYVFSLDINSNDTTLYVGGDFFTINGSARNHIALVNTADWTVDSFDPNPSAASSVHSILLTSSSVLYIGGSFPIIKGEARQGFAAFNFSGYTLTYTAGDHGSIHGASPQAVADGANGDNVTAIPDFGYSFNKWSDSGSDNPSRTDKNVHGDITTTASFNLIPTFNTTWRTTSDLESIIIPTTGDSYSYMVDWGDGTSDATVYTGDATHTYDLAGDYHVSITPETADSFPRIFFNEAVNPEKIISVDQWGGIRWTSMQAAFAGCNNLTIAASAGAPDLSMATDTSYMFLNATKVNDYIDSSWDVSTIQNMYGMFQSAMSFNQDISSWDVSGVNNMGYLFENDPAFNQDIHLWNVASVTNMDSMFYGATTFNNGDQPLTWDANTHIVSNMSSMFRNDTAFDQDISSWNVSSVSNMTDMFTGDTLSITNYDALLTAWSSEMLQETVTFDAGNSKYCSSTTQRAFIESNFGWTINDAGIGCHTFTYTAGIGGTINGVSTQVVNDGSDGELVTATPNLGYRFVNWSDTLSTTAERTDTNIGLDINATANFELIPTVTTNHTTTGSYLPGYGPRAIINSKPSLGELKLCSADQILTQDLKAGARNGKYNSFTKGIVKEVKILQAHMNRLGFASGKEDGILGPITDGAIKRMQKYLGTYTDGMIGPITRGLINNSCGKN